MSTSQEVIVLNVDPAVNIATTKLPNGDHQITLSNTSGTKKVCREIKDEGKGKPFTITVMNTPQK